MDAEVLKASQQFITQYEHLKAIHKFGDREFMWMLGYKSASYLSDIRYGRTHPSFEFLVKVKMHFPEMDMNAIFGKVAPYTESVSLYVPSRKVLHFRESRLQKKKDTL